jgi:hypothetical protein
MCPQGSPFYSNCNLSLTSFYSTEPGEGPERLPRETVPTAASGTLSAPCSSFSSGMVSQAACQPARLSPGCGGKMHKPHPRAHPAIPPAVHFKRPPSWASGSGSRSPSSLQQRPPLRCWLRSCWQALLRPRCTNGRRTAIQTCPAAPAMDQAGAGKLAALLPSSHHARTTPRPSQHAQASLGLRLPPQMAPCNCPPPPHLPPKVPLPPCRAIAPAAPPKAPRTGGSAAAALQLSALCATLPGAIAQSGCLPAHHMAKLSQRQPWRVELGRRWPPVGPTPPCKLLPIAVSQQRAAAGALILML